MHLSSLYIDGFGPFEDSLISEFTEGLNLVVAEDEPAAVALRDFIWSVIFGFESDNSGIEVLETPTRRASGGFLGFDSPDGPVTVARYRRAGADSNDDQAGLVTITGPVGSLDQIIGRVGQKEFRRLVQIDAREITAFRQVVRRQIAETFAEKAREAAEAEAVLREGAGQIDVPTIEEIMDEMRIARDYQVARSDNLARSVKGVGRRLRGSRRREARLKILEQVRPTWNTMLELQRQMDDLPRLPYLSDDPIGRLEEVTAGRAEAQAQLDAAQAAETAKSSELDGLRPSEEEAARYREIHELVPAREGHTRLLDATAEAEKEFHGAQADLESDLSEIGKEWSAERVREFAAAVDPAEINEHDDAIQQAADTLDSAEQNNTSALNANAEFAVELAATQTAIHRIGDLAAGEESDLALRLGTLRSLKATVLAIAGKKNVIADLHIKRSDARRLGSGVSRIVMQAQSITSAAFLFVGLIVWGAAKIAADNPVQRTGMVMIGAGIVGVLFAVMFLWLQRHPTFGRSVIRKDRYPKEAQQTADSSGQDAAAVWLWSSLTLPTAAARALISIVRWTFARVPAPGARARQARLKKAEMSVNLAVEDQSSNTDKTTSQESHARDSGGEDEKPSEKAAKGRSLFGIRELLGRFIQIERREAESAGVEAGGSHETGDEDHEPESDDTGSEVDEKKASVAMAEAEASIPEELREAQRRNDRAKGRIGSLLARVLKFADETEDQSDEEVLGEMSEDGIWSASGQKRRPFVMRLVSSLRASVDRARPASPPVSEDDEDEESEDEAAAPTEAAGDERSDVVGESKVDEEPAAESDASEIQEQAEEATEEEEADSAAEEPEAAVVEAEGADEPGDGGGEEPAAAMEEALEAGPEPAEAEEASEAGPEPAEAEEASEAGPEPAEAEEASEAGPEPAEAEISAVESEPVDEVPVADGAEEPHSAEVAAEEVTYEFGDPIEALDEALETATRELDALTGEFEKLVAQYAESLGPKVDGGRPPMTVELIDHATTETGRQITTLREAAELRSKLTDLEEKREESQKAVAGADDQLREATASSEAALDKWVQWLSEAGLDTDLDPDGVRKISKALDPVRVRISAVEILREKLEGLQASAGELEDRVRQVADVSENDDLAAAFDAVERGAEAATALEEKLADLEEMSRSLIERTSEAEIEANRAESLLRATLDEIGAEDEGHFRELTDGAAKRRRLADELDQMRIDTPLLTGVDSAELEEELRTVSQEQVEAELAELPGHIDRLQAQLSSLERDLTQSETELAGMPEMPGEDAGDDGMDAAAGRDAMPVLLRRPLGRSAMQAATRNIERFTAGKYRGFSTVASEDGESIVGYKVVDANGKVDDPEESEAASVFMALRVALIED
ncbi:MAG: hypothetical protein IH868_09055, partial [Chloroflexi bacterium]|nr:hypothetical protein [Chloroflexota bacterium]